LIEMATWLCAGLEQAVTPRLAAICESGPGVGAAAFAESLAAYVDEERPET
jgi:hypothetical protein